MEVITVAPMTISLMQDYFRTDKLRQTYQLVSENAPAAFTEQHGYRQWIRRLDKLTDLAGRPAQAAASGAAATNLKLLCVVDPLQILLFKPIWHGQVRPRGEDGTYFGRSAQEWFHGS